MVIEAGCPPHLAADVVEFIEGKNPHIRGLGWWTDLHSKGHLAFHVQEALTELARPIGNSDSDDTTSPDCVTCHDSGKVEVRNMYEGDSAKVIDCPDCTNNGRGRCRIHPTYASRRCAACRGDRLARGNEQPRSGQRGNPRILRNSHENQERYDVPIGAYLGSSHQAYRNPEDDSVYSDWSNR
ncbi:hypothetical protein ACGFIW_01330 [Micromonospora sp. NPDC048935]|uniref:hypothetical protein n=1 Tax=Micromonospora sp. NPDC048935 TaxID=3364262 RepID=UPI00371D19F8